MKHTDSTAYDSIEALGVGIALQWTRLMLRISDNIQWRERLWEGQWGSGCACNIMVCKFMWKDKISLWNESISLGV